MLKKLTTLALVSIFAFNFANAQTIKNCDISVEITSPVNNAVIPHGDSVFVSFNYTNHGPDVLPAGDTLFFDSPAGVLFSALLIDLPVNSTIIMNNSLIVWNPTNDTLSADICILHVPQDSITYANGSHPTKTYNDSNTVNDLSCVHIFLKGLDSTTAIKNIGSENPLLSLYPNPAKDVIHFQLNQQLQSVYSNAIITDIQGRIVKTVTPLRSVGNEYSINISNLNNGIYFIELQSQDAVNKVKGKMIISK